MWAKERRKMAKKAADADGGSRATKSSVHWMVVSDDFENWEARFVLPMDITAFSITQRRIVQMGTGLATSEGRESNR